MRRDRGRLQQPVLRPEPASTAAKDLLPRRPIPRLRGLRGPAKAVTAIGHSILTAARHMLQTGELYRDLGSDLGSDYFTRQNPDRTPKRLIRPLEALGHRVTREQSNAKAPGPESH